MKWKQWTTWLLLLLTWIGLAAWQSSEYQRMRRLAFNELEREAQTVNSALIGGIRTHRRMGLYFEENLQDAIDDVAKSETVVAAAIESDDGTRLATAGNRRLLDADSEVCREASAFAYRDQFELSSAGSRPFEGQGGQGPGRGRGPGRHRSEELPTNDVTAKAFRTVLLLDASPTENRCRQEAQLRGLVVAAGTFVLLCVALVWRSTLRTAEARGRARLLESEARHLRDLSQAAAGLAHETRNPLGLIRGWTQRLADDLPGTEEHRVKAQSIVEECDRVTARINQFLSFARPSKTETETVVVRDVVDELATLLEPVLDAKSLELECDAVDSALTIQADREMFRQALFNLLQNAVQFSSDAGVIEVAVRQSSAGTKRIEVADRGQGVPADAEPALFTPYFTTRPDGTGLGLAIVRRIAMAHGWQTGHTARPGGGSVFWLDQIDE